MEEKPTLDMVYMATSALFRNTNTVENEKACQWLEDLQKSVHAWTIADELLHHKKDLESCYFAAQTMRSKVHNSFHELPLDAHNSLRDSLIGHISQINEATNAAIVTQLSLALADLALQMPLWQKATLDLILKFSQTNLWSLLEILTVIPEEWESRSLRLGENRRVELLADFTFCAPTVSEFLTHCCNTYGKNWLENIPITVKILRCFNSWTSISAIQLHTLTEHVVVAKAFEILKHKTENKINVSGSLHETSTDTICTLLQCLEDNNNQQALETYLFNNVIDLEIQYHLSVANEDQEKSMNYCRIFTELGESFLEKIISSSSSNKQFHYAVKVLDLVLICVGHHDYEVAEITFNLWYVLSEELYQKNNKELTEMFKPYVERLVTALCRHCQMEPDHEGLLEDGDEFKDFRLKVSDLIKDVVFIVGSSSCFRQMFINLQSPNTTWDASEAALYVMQAVAKNIVPTEQEIVPQVVEAILNLPEHTHISVRHTSVLLLGELCEWIEKHPETLDPILNFLVSCLSQPGVGAASAAALQNICATCNDHMPRHVPVLLQLLRQVDTFAITNIAVIGLLRGVSAIIGCMPHGDLSVALKEMILMQLNPLCILVEQDVVPVRGTKTDPVLWLDRLSSIFRNVHVKLEGDTVNPCICIVLETWPMLSRVFNKYQADARIMERSCRTIRFMLRCVSQQAKELLNDLVGQIISIYTVHSHSCFLYVGSILVDEYANDSSCITGLLDMLQAFIEPTFRILQEQNGLRNHPDTVDDFFRLCARFLQRAPRPFLKCVALEHIFQCALSACSLDHKEANMSVMKFFNDLIAIGRTGKLQVDYAERQDLVKTILEQYGQQLVTNLLHACLFYLHSYMISEVADVFVELLEFDRGMTEKWLANGLDGLPKQSNGGVMGASPEQLRDIHVAISRSDTSKSISHALKDLTRFYR